MTIPSLQDIPKQITTARLFLRTPQTGDGILLNAAVINSFDQLTKYMPWADHKPTHEESELFCIQAQAQWLLGQELTFYIFDLLEQKQILGVVSLHTIDWTVPRFEIGYWINSSYANKGIITEATNAVATYAFKKLNAQRIEIRCDEDNIPSRRIAEKLNFIQEGILLKHQQKPHHKGIRNTVIYACYDIKQLTT
ncbi:GNAT family N-acetyltransferase [Candidatus Dependentiae bacterium]|nr:GNAT family N-acetyltransferase [Candidatus Dependentiae bacterium]